MNYNELFSNVVSRSKASAIRELLKVISRPGIISFAGGLPDPTLFPTKEIQNIFDTILTNSAREALQYGSTEGQDSFKKELVRMLKETEKLASAGIKKTQNVCLSILATVLLRPAPLIWELCRLFK